ncbi:MAG: PD-(D/E)XK nuclease family protein, partial [Pseudomonadota bacterium]
ASKPRPPLRIAAPSRLSEDRAPVLSPFGPARAAALHRGRLIHALLQVLPALPPEERGQSAAAFLAQAPDLSDKAREEILTTTLKTLEAPDFKAIFAPGGRSEAAIVGTLAKGQMVNGRVDRLVITPEKIMIIDYKTDRPAPAAASDIGEAYLVQMAAYRAVMRALYPDGRPIEAALLYTDGPKLFALDPLLLSESLKRVTSPV